jgi:hypothetical protein
MFFQGKQQHGPVVLKRLAILLFLSCSSPASAHVVDLATMSEAGGPYEVSFCARPSPEAFGFPGHAFVAFSKGNGGDRQFTALGLTVAGDVSPVAAALSYFEGVSGQLAEERMSHLRQRCLTVRVNKASYDRAYASTRPVLERLGIGPTGGRLTEFYRLSANDCITYAAHVAALLKTDGLVVPDRRGTDLPIDFILRLKAAN